MLVEPGSPEMRLHSKGFGLVTSLSASVHRSVSHSLASERFRDMTQRIDTSRRKRLVASVAAMTHKRNAIAVLMAALALASGISLADRALHFGPPER